MEGVMVNLTTNMGTGGEAMGDTLRNIELVWGSEKDDTFIAGPGADIIEGDGGSDTVSYETSELGVTVDLSNDEHTGRRLLPATALMPARLCLLQILPLLLPLRIWIKTVSMLYLIRMTRKRKPTALPATSWAVSRT